MRDSKNHPVIAVDGGGTRCRFAFAHANERIVIETGSANVSTNFDAACSEITRGIEALVMRAGLDWATIASIPAYFGLAGAIDQKITDRLASAMPFTHVRIEDDRTAALRGALGASDGMIAHCGTGSFVAARMNGATRLVGGWGSVLGDPSSAQWVGRRALSRTLDVVDGLRAEADLSNLLLQRHGGAAGIVAWAAAATAVDFGAIARDVTRCAEQGDQLAKGILQDASDAISDILKALGWVPGTTICLTGGIGPHFAPYLPSAMQHDLAAPLGEPLDGAVALAQDFCRDVSHERL